jgi:asparagine synthase (glutamine-hydrolysing)
MEGICGLIGFNGDQTEIDSKIDLMAGSLSDGEPLQISKLCGSNWALACGGWSTAHWQPITFTHQHDGLVLAGVADIHNLGELVAKRGMPGSNVGAVLAACYRAEPNDWPLSIRGNFAVLIIDVEARRFMTATDRLGIRPLYWSKQGQRYYLSSRLDAIRRVCPALEINASAIYAYMHNSMVPSPHTIYANVQKLEPGFLLKAGSERHEVVRYWDISATPKIAGSVDEIAGQVFQQIESAVALMKNGIAAEEELGCFLSGGTDSSSICGLLSRMTRHPVAAFSIGFPENGYDEMFYARVAAKAFGLAHHEFYIQPHDVLQLLPAIVGAHDEPFGNASVIPTFFGVRSAASNGVRYMLAGDGGDEIFAGNERYGTQQLFRNYFRVPKAIRAGLLEPLLLNRLDRLSIEIFRKAGSYIRRAKMPEVERLQSYRYVTNEEMFTPSFMSANDLEAIARVPAKHFEELPGAAPLDRHLYLDMKLTITDNDLRKVTRACDLAQVRVRYPMLDYPVVNLGFRIPADLKLKGTTGLRYIFKRAFRELLPQEILTKQKHGFGLPISQWLRNDPKIKQFAHDLLFAQKHLQRGYFRPDFVKRLWELQLSDNTPYYGAMVWQMVMLEAWHRRHMENEELQVMV